MNTVISGLAVILALGVAVLVVWGVLSALRDILKDLWGSGCFAVLLLAVVFIVVPMFIGALVDLVTGQAGTFTILGGIMGIMAFWVLCVLIGGAGM